MEPQKINTLSNKIIQSINPFTQKVIGEYTVHNFFEAKKIIAKSHKTQQTWSQTSFKERSELFQNMAQTLEKNKNTYAQIITSEMGKPIKQSRSEIEKCAWLCEFYSKNGEAFLKSESIDAGYKLSNVYFQPLGVILGIMPWNFPFWQVYRFIVPSLMAGNTTILKHASNVSLCSMEIQKVLEDSGFPMGAMTSIIYESENMEQIISQPEIKAVTLTGSTKAGKSVASLAGKYLKKSVMELGGSDPYIIFADADLDKATQLCVKSRLLNSGQSCIEAKRFIIHESIYDHFKEKFLNEIHSYTLDDPQKEECKIGPLARMDLREQLHKQVCKSIEAGARCIVGGAVENETTPFYPVTVLENAQPGSPAYSEELFGPVAVLFSFKDDDEAVRIANDTSFGLGSSIFSKDYDKCLKLAVDKLEAGACFINDFVQSDPRLPFGGIKESGYGRELSSFGIKEFTNIKTVALSD